LNTVGRSDGKKRDITDATLTRLSLQKQGSTRVAFGSKIALTRRVVELKFECPPEFANKLATLTGLSLRRQGSTRMAFRPKVALTRGWSN
jgi:hypothetical protein